MAGDRDRAAPLGTRYVERFLRRLFGLAGPTVADHLRGDVSPSIEVRPWFPQDRDAFGVIPWTTGPQLSAAAPATNSGVQLQAPLLPDQPYDLVVTRVWCDSATWVIRAYPIVEPGTTTAIFHRDSAWQRTGQWGAGNITQFSSRTVQVAAPAGGILYQYGSAAQRVWQEIDVVLRFGSQAHIAAFNLTVNQAATVIFEGLLVPAQVSLI